MSISEQFNPYPSSKPWTRWWWFSGEILERDIVYQLEWLAANGFGGVEIAWVYPQKDAKPGTAWLSREWSELVGFTKRSAEKLGLGCDFTLGTLWPFGGSLVKEEDASQVYGGLSNQRLKGTWETPFVPEPAYILNHLDRNALGRYANPIGKALKDALKGSKSALFCDSWEVETEKLWTNGFGETFKSKFGYSIEPFMDKLDENPDVRYDYRKLIAQFALEEFYKPFTSICHELGAMSRVQCHGSPTDLLASYGEVDIPETEAILFEPNFARIAGSAAALTGKAVVSCETFTCLYGWKPRPGPAPCIKQEKVGDLKLLADSLFANGVNHIFWHGMPHNPEGGNNEFYATVHVGPDSPFAEDLSEFNSYMRGICSVMRRGRTYSSLGVYFPLEDSWMAGELPPGEYSPDAKYFWEMRYTGMPPELKGYHPLWVSGYYLKGAGVIDGNLVIGDAVFKALYIEVEWLDEDSLIELVRLARVGLKICMKCPPSQPGHVKTESYQMRLDELSACPNVSSELGSLRIGPPLVEGRNLPDFWCRVVDGAHFIFFANPTAMDVHYPMRYGQSDSGKIEKIPVRINAGSKKIESVLVFEPNQSVLVEI